MGYSLGSIPVHTGKPFLLRHGVALPRVYPRTHGETHLAICTCKDRRGLSPYTRGNHIGRTIKACRPGSIPVHTGKPGTPAKDKVSISVYPRTHGETNEKFEDWAILEGLSPYTRGNHAIVACKCRPGGSIPVHTGKPVSNYACSIPFGVYPRTHGETMPCSSRVIHDRGLSPYTRGNRSRASSDPHRTGSIPVHTGKPLACALAIPGPGNGLSPYTRGNPIDM